MRDRSYLTPMGQVVVGGLVLIACFAWPPLLLIVCLVLIGRLVGRLIGRASRGDKLSAATAAAVILVLTIVLVYAVPSFALVVVAMGLAAAVWLLATSLRTAKSTT